MKSRWGVIIIPIFVIYFIRNINGAGIIDFTSILEIFNMQGISKQTIYFIFTETEKILVQTFNPWVDVLQAEDIIAKILAFVAAIKNTITGVFQLGIWGATVITYIGKVIFGQIREFFIMGYEILGFR